MSLNQSDTYIMDKNKSALEQFLEGAESQVNNPFEPVSESPIDTPPEQTVENKEEKPLPFHQDPKIQKFIAKEVAKGLQNRTSEPQTQTKESDEFKDVMDAMTAAIGNDTPEKQAALKAYENALKGIDQRSSTKTQQFMDEVRERELREQKEAEEELDNAFEAIEETFDVDLTSPRSQKTRSEFLTFVEKIAPKDRDGEILGYPDMNSAWETFSEMRKPGEPSRAKQLASRGMSRSSEAITVQPKKMDWNAVEDYMDSLK